MTDNSLRAIIDDNTRSALQVGLVDIANGRVSDWSTEDIKKRGRERLAKNG